LEAPLNQPYAAIFDMDGVLIDSYDAHFQSWREIAAAEGFDFTEELFAHGFGRTSREIIREVWGRDSISDEEIVAIGNRKEEAFRRLIEHKFPVMPGIVDALRVLHQAGFRLAVGSSGPPQNVELALHHLDGNKVFNAVVTGDDVKRGKPDPQVFTLAAERLGVAPSRCAVIEDAPAGIAAANSAGMASIGFASTGRRPDELTAARTIIQKADEITPQLLRDLIDRQLPTHG
jgi:beta-phosphoglucomutase